MTTPLPGSGQGAGGPAWSPDGTRLVYTVSTNGVSTLWIMNADGSAKRQLTTGANGSAFDPAWSADGQQIAFRQESTAPLQTMLAFVSALDGTQQFPVFNLFAMTATPAYSPDGNWLLASNSAGGDIATLYVTPLKALGEPRIVLPASLGGARAARWIKRP